MVTKILLLKRLSVQKGPPSYDLQPNENVCVCHKHVNEMLGFLWITLTANSQKFVSFLTQASYASQNEWKTRRLGEEESVYFWQFSILFSQIWLKKRHTSLFSGICREIRTKFHQKFLDKMQNSKQKINRKFSIHARKNVDAFWRKFWDLSGAKYVLGKSCRSR